MSEEKKGHVHAALIMKQAEIAQHDPKPGRHFQIRSQDKENNWRDYLDAVCEFNHWREYRLKPQTVNVRGFEVNAPRTEAPEKGTAYWMTDPTIRLLSCRHTWHGEKSDYLWLERGLVFDIEEDAAAMAKAMLGIDPTEGGGQ